ncbi:MAG: DUF2203 domain-containing protein [Polyangiales bacterium]
MRRYFSLNEANTLVQSLQPLVKDAVRVHAQLRKISMDLIKNGVPITEDILAEKEKVDAKPEHTDQLEQAQAMYGLLVSYVKKIESTGAMVKGVSQGLLDFPSLMNGTTQVLLCWRLGERAIVSYHPIDQGFDSRKSIEGQEFLTAYRDEREPS